MWSHAPSNAYLGSHTRTTRSPARILGSAMSQPGCLTRLGTNAQLKRLATITATIGKDLAILKHRAIVDASVCRLQRIITIRLW